MGLKRMIPGTQARREYLFAQSINNMADGHDGVARVEFPDGVVSYKPVDVDPMEDQLETPDGYVFRAKGLGSEPGSLMGVNVWTVDATNYGVISSQAARIGARERTGDVYEGAEALQKLLEAQIEAAVEQGDIEPGEGPVELDAEAEPDPVEAEGAEPVATDGAGARTQAPRAGSAPGYASAAEELQALLDTVDEDLTVYDLRDPDGFDGEAYKVREASDFDPWPVREADARSAFRAAQDAMNDAAAGAKWFFIGMLTAIGLWFMTTQVPRIVGTVIGAGGGGSNPSVSAPEVMGALLSVPLPGVV